jgi:Protein of unknown function (DUF3891)
VLVRPEDGGALLIAQQAHAWVSGQIARAWGNEQVAAPEPREQVCLAAEQHDLGMTSFDMDPTIDPETGLPHSFLEMPTGRHLAIWRLAPRRMLVQDRYAALLVSMHGVSLYERREPTPAVREYISEQQAFQRELAESLGVTDEEMERNQKLIWTFDALSLAVLLGWDPFEVEGIERRGSTLDPWPFGEDSLTLRCDGRRLERGAPLSTARWVEVEVSLSR